MAIRRIDRVSPRTGQPMYVVDYHDQYGKRHQPTFDTKKQADAAWRRINAEMARGEHAADADSCTMKAAYETFIGVIEDEGSARSTIEGHRGLYKNHVAPMLGAKLVSRLTPPDIQRWLDELRRTGRTNDTIARAKKTAGAILDEAVRQGYCGSNPVRNLRRRRRARRAAIAEQKRKIIIPEKHEVRALVEAAGRTGERWIILRRQVGGHLQTVSLETLDGGDDLNARLAEVRRERGTVEGQLLESWAIASWLRPFVVTMAFAGLRIGEARGLPWESLDLEGGYLKVTQAVDNFGVLDSVKTVAGLREVPIGPYLVNVLRAWHKTTGQPKRGLVFPSRRGTPLGYRNVLQRHFGPLLLRLGMVAPDGTPRYTPHQLRHFAVSLWIDQGSDPKQVSQWVGHESVAFTMDVYGHLFKDRARDRDRITAAELDVLGAVTAAP